MFRQLFLTVPIALTLAVTTGHAQERPIPTASLVPADPITFPGPTDSNSPAFWRLRDGTPWFFLMNSSEEPRIAGGPDETHLGTARLTPFDDVVNGHRWMEAVVPDSNGTLYGYYHIEPAGVCPGVNKTAPRIGAARSKDGGRSWQDLGIVLEAPPGSNQCDTPNTYDVGGVGDFSVMLDADQRDLYFFYSSYVGDIRYQGVSAARLLWADRDKPQGRATVWDDGVWLAPEATEDGTVYPLPPPIFPARVSWHDPSGAVDALWGPSVHWNTFLQQYVMLLNHATDSAFGSEGIYVSFNPSLDNPAGWSKPARILEGGTWYPQVLGTEPQLGTDKLAGERARFFNGGVSNYEIVFEQPERAH